MYFNEYPDLLDLLDEMLDKFPKIEKNLKMKKASVYKLLGDLDAGFRVVDELLEKNPEDKELRSFKAYWYQYMDKREEALKIFEELIEIEKDNGEYYDSYGEILMNYQEYAKAVEQFQKAIKLSGSGWFIYQTYIKMGICFKELEDYELAVEYLKKGKEYTNKCFCDYELKKKWLIIADIFLTDIESS
jgi:tetratricopeptide (TPR) repeat protein